MYLVSILCISSLLGSEAEPSLARVSSSARSDAPATRGQRESGLPMTIGVFAPYLVQPGVRVGAPLVIRDWPSAGCEVQCRCGRTLSLFAGPQIAFFTRPGHHLDLMVEGEFGGRWLSHRRGLFASLSLSVGYLLSSQVIAESIDLATGERDKTREERHHLVPAINTTFGQERWSGLGWFVRFSAGEKRSHKVASSLWYSAEVGVRVRIGGKGP